MRASFLEDTLGFQRQDWSACLPREEVEVAGQDVKTGEFGLDEDCRGKSELDGV
jgi:hypothetical protein